VIIQFLEVNIYEKLENREVTYKSN